MTEYQVKSKGLCYLLSLVLAIKCKQMFIFKLKCIFLGGKLLSMCCLLVWGCPSWSWSVTWRFLREERAGSSSGRAAFPQSSPTVCSSLTARLAFPFLCSLHMTSVLCAMNLSFRSVFLDQTPDVCCCCVVLSDELQTVLKMMLASEPLERASVPQLLSLPSVRRRLWRRRLSLFLQETALRVASLYQVRPGTFQGILIPVIFFKGIWDLS